MMTLELDTLLYSIQPECFLKGYILRQYKLIHQCFNSCEEYGNTSLSTNNLIFFQKYYTKFILHK